MKKICLLLSILAFTMYRGFSQNTFPASGNVGIGTSSPSYLLHLYSTTSTPPFAIQNPTTTSYSQLSYIGTGRTFNTGVGNASETIYGVANSYYVYDGGSNTMRMVINSSGSVGINTTSPAATLDVNGSVIFGVNGGRFSIDQGGFAINRNVDNGQIYNSGQFAYQFGKQTNSTNGASDILALSVWYPNQTQYDVTYNALSINGQGHVGVYSDAPYSMFQVDDGVSKASIGSAGDIGSSALGYGTSYYGFNAARYYSGSGSTQSWFLNADGSNNNGGGVIYGTVQGAIEFAPLASVANSAGQTLTDAQIASAVVMKITPTAVYAKQIYVQTTGFPDYVFKKNYRLRPLSDVKSYIDKYHHLPELSSAAQIEKDGVNLGEMNKLLTKKVEELTLYLIEKDKQLQAEQCKNESQQKQLDAIQKQLNALAKKLN